MNNIIILIGGNIMKINIIDKFLFKLLFLTLILLCVVVLNKHSIINHDLIKTKLSENINVVNIIKAINGKLNIIDLSNNDVIVNIDDHIIEEVNNNEYIYYLKENNVYNYTLGNVIKIEKNNMFYSVTILDENNNLIIYDKLSEINVKIYEIVKTNDLIGKACINDKNNNGYL